MAMPKRNEFLEIDQQAIDRYRSFNRCKLYEPKVLAHQYADKDMSLGRTDRVDRIS